MIGRIDEYLFQHNIFLCLNYTIGNTLRYDST